MKKSFIEDIENKIDHFPPVFQSLIPFLFLTLMWLIIEFLVNPVGEFPFSDDWMYARCVHLLVTKGAFQLCDFQAVTLFTQALWGALFTLPFGFSMTALRFSVVVLGWLGLGILYQMMRESGANRFLSFLAALSLATTPFYVLFSNTFMTDVPFVVSTTGAFIFLIRWIKNEKISDLVFGILLACATSLIRQLGLVIPVSFALAYLVKKEFKPKAFLVAAVACCVVGGTLFIYHKWLKSFGGLPVMYLVKQGTFKAMFTEWSGAFRNAIIQAFFMRLLVVVIYLGMFFFPFMLIVAPAQWQRCSVKERWLGAAGIALYWLLMVVFLNKIGRWMPIGMDQFFDIGLGKEHVEGNTAFLSSLPSAPPLLWKILTIVGLWGGGWLVFHGCVILKRLFMALWQRRHLSEQWDSVLYLAAFMTHFSIFGISGHFDRYQLVYMPFLLFWMVRSSGPVTWSSCRIRLPIALLLLAVIAYFSVAATHDCLTRNRTRWDVLRYLMHQVKIPPSEIDGGYEFNGWYTYDPNYRKREDMNWWWVVDDKYRISYGTAAKGYEPFARMSYKRWLPPGEGNIFVLKRIADERPPNVGPSKTVYEF